MKRWLTTSLQLLIVAGAVAHDPPATDGRSPAAAVPPRDLKILSWNIYMLPGIVPMKGQVSRAHAIADTIVRCDFDIIVFQEAFHHGAVRVIEQALASAYPYMYGPFNEDRGPAFNSGVWVLSRIPLRVLATIEFGKARNFDRFARKGAALLEGEWNGRAFQLIGTHLQAADHPDVRREQFNELYAGLLLPFQREGVPQIICGDMNTEHAHTGDHHTMLDRLRAEDGSLEGEQRQSYDAKSNKLAHKVWKNACTTVDYVLLRFNGAVIPKVKRTVSVIKSRWRKHSEDLSDHYGVVCELKL
jgi:endonuclease/exonuclease/phosphatase family metal-dependent hydrolase